MLLGEDYEEKFIGLIENLHKQGNAKKEIYTYFRNWCDIRTKE